MGTNYRLHNHTQIYQTEFARGKAYEDFIKELFKSELFIDLTFYQTQCQQFNIGETAQGFEIKFDERSLETSHLWIEYMEKSNHRNAAFVDSGIRRSDNTWLYCIGNYSRVFVFSKKILNLLHESNRYENKEIPTSRGFVLPISEAKKFCAKEIIAPPEFLAEWHKNKPITNENLLGA
jgi:hypothetical protein